MRATRRWLYRMARLLGDLNALVSGSPGRMVRRASNKWLGRKVIRRLWR